MAKSPTKFDSSTLTNALKQVYYIHKNIVADLNAKLDVLADENGKLQAQKSSGMSGECSSCHLLKDMNQRLQETFNALLKDKEAAIKSLTAKLGKVSKENSGKDLDTSENLESSELLENKLTRREGESHEAQREKNENHGVNINDENNDTKTHSKLQLLRQGKRSIRYIEEVPNPKRMKVSPTDNPGRLTVHHHSSNLASVKWAAMLVPETEPDAIQKKHETSRKPDDLGEIEVLSEHMLIVPETIGLDYTIRSVECDNSIVENERDNNGHGIARADFLSAANDSKMLSKKVVHLEDCSLTDSHSDRTEESQDPCTQITNRKLMSKGSPAVVKTMKGIGVEKENGKPPDGFFKERNQSGAGSTSRNSLEIHDAVKDVTNSNKIDPNGQASRKPTEDKGKIRKISDKSAERSMGEPVSIGTEMNQQVPRGDKLSDTKKKSQLCRSEQQQQASKNSGPKFLQPTSPNSLSSAAPKVSPKGTVHLGESKHYNPSVKLRGSIDQNSVVVHKQGAPPSPSNFLNDSGDLKDETKKRIVEKIIEVNLDPNGSMNPDVNLSEILASQTSAKAVRGRLHSQSSNKVMNAFDETIAPSSLLQHEGMNAFDETIAPSSLLQHDETWRPDVTSPAKSSQQFSSTLDEGTLKATQGSSTPHNHKRSLESTSPKNRNSTLKSLVPGGKVKSDIPTEKGKLHVTNPQKKLSSYSSSGMYDKVNCNVQETDDDDDDESIAPSPQAHFQAGSQLHCSIPSSSRSFKFSHKPNKFQVRSDSTTAVKLQKDLTNKNATNPSSVSVRLVGDEGESLDLQAALEEIDRSQTLHEENLEQSITEVTSPQKSSKQYSPVQSFEDSFDRVPKNKEVEFPHVEVVRKKSEREKLEGFSCRECYEYYKTSGLSEEEMKQRMNQCSRHRHKFVAPATPEHFWSLGFPDTAEIMERSTLSKMDNETPAPAEKGPRRRRRLEKKF